MIEKKIEIYVDAVVQSNLNNIELICELNGFYAITALLNTLDKKVIAYEYFEFTNGDGLNNTFSELKNTSKILSKNYHSAKVFYNFPETLVVPELYDNKPNADIYLNTFYGNLKDSVVKTDKTSAFDNVGLLYSIDEKFQQLIEDTLHPASAKHSCTKLLENIYSNQQDNDGDCMYLFFYNQMFIVALVNNKQLQFVKSVNYKLPEEVLYFVLNVTKQYQVNIDQLNLKISGFINFDSEELTLIRKYFAHIVLDKQKDSLVAEYFFRSYPKHYFTPFFYLLA